MVKYLFVLLVFCVSLLAEFEVSGYVGLNSQAYLTAKDAKHKDNFTAEQELEIKYFKDELSVYAKIYAQEDSYDLSDKKNERSFVRLDELYLKYDFDNDMISAGKNIMFWGSLEVRNIVDGFNPQDFRTDLFGAQKLGVYNFSYSHFTDSGEISAIIKFDKPDQTMAASPYVYYFFPSFVSYDGKVKDNEADYRPSVFLKYSGSTDTEYALDYAFIYENGYDSQRYFLPDGPLNGSPVDFNQFAYITNKFMTYNTLVVGSTLIKLEALYAVVNNNAYVGDYSHVALGFEHTIENFMDSDAALGLITEYYRYDTYEDGKYGDLKLFETMQNDLFIGLRYSFNNANDSTIIGGVIADVEYDEQTYYMKAATRAFDSLKVEFNYYLIEPSTDTLTANALLGKHQRVSLDIAWYF